MIDNTLFAAKIAAGSYAPGDTVELTPIKGSATVRSGRGAAILKRITTGEVNITSGSTSKWKIYVQNSDWIDPAASFSTQINVSTALDNRSGAVCDGQNAPLTPNSSWRVWAECVETVTTTVDNDIFALLDIDFPSVASILNPAALVGFPTSLEHKATGAAINADGTLTTANWAVQNVDIFKAGYEYALVKTELVTESGAAAGFIAINDAAGMQGLTRIIPITSYDGAIRAQLDYASKLVKGPMNIEYILFNQVGAGATTANIQIILDYVKRRTA